MSMQRTGWMRHATIAIGFLAATAMWSPSRADDPKPGAAVKTKAIEANVFINNRIKADPALAADCLAEGKKWLAKNAADAARR